MGCLHGLPQWKILAGPWQTFEVKFFSTEALAPQGFLGDLCKQELDNIWLLLQSPKEGQNKLQITVFFLESSYNGKEEE